MLVRALEGPSRSLTSETSAQDPPPLLPTNPTRMLLNPLSYILLPSPPLQRSPSPGHRPTPPPKPWRDRTKGMNTELLAPFPLWGCIYLLCCLTPAMYTPTLSIYHLWRSGMKSLFILELKNSLTKCHIIHTMVKSN